MTLELIFKHVDSSCLHTRMQVFMITVYIDL